MKEIHIPVKEMAYYLHSSGDLTRDFFQNADPTEGNEAHLYLQNRYNSTDLKEYYVKEELEALDCRITIKGFIDGVLNNGMLLEEIKSTHQDVNKMEKITHFEHLAQLKIYCYLYCHKNSYEEIDARLTYISIDDYETKSFYFHFDFQELEKYFFDSLFTYLEWLIKLDDQKIIMKKTIDELKFPFPKYRKGQREFMKYIYCTIKDKDILYAIAPTGIGKTMACIYSSLKSMDKLNKIFYLTAKSLGKSVCISAMKILKTNGLVCKSIELSSKDKTCFLEERNCDVSVCPYMKGYYDRLQQAIREMYDSDDIWCFDSIRQMAMKHQICPFEFSLDLSYFADVIIADYNYAFCPRTHLIRYFDDDKYNPILLVDEAHNLVSRSKDMYSAQLNKETLIELRKLLSKIKPSSRKQINDCIKFLDDLALKYGHPIFYNTKEKPNAFLELTYKLAKKIEKILKENIEFKNRFKVMNLYFEVNRFNKISQFFNHNYRFIMECSEDINISLSCLDASEFILKTINNRSFGTIFFSATMYPLNYYKKLLTMDKGESLIIPSPFNQRNLKLIIKNDTSTKYQDRDNSIDEIIKTIDAMISYKKGNYIVFFPSYEYLNMVYHKIKNNDYNIILQDKEMTELERINTLKLFEQNEKTQVGFFVMGGSFSEGIDYIGDMLSGVLIISVAIPLISNSNNILVDHFNEVYNDGFNYAYTYPGFTKVVQAVGRVIRTETDKGVAILFDTRFNKMLYQGLMPNEWSHRKIINNLKDIKNEIIKFKEDN